MKGDNPEEAIDEFLGVPALEEEKGDWYILLRNTYSDPHSLCIFRGFKGLKQAIKLEFKLKRYDMVCILCCDLLSD